MKPSADIYILGGSQTDFARNWAREGLGLYDMFAETLREAVATSATSSRNCLPDRA
jgi:acetyl-CoA C-acetyltransferase